MEGRWSHHQPDRGRGCESVGITSVDLRILNLAVQLVAASRQVFSFNNLEAIQQRLLEGGSIPDLLQTLIETLVVTAAQR